MNQQMELSKRIRTFFRGYDGDAGHVVPEQLQHQWIEDAKRLEAGIGALQEDRDTIAEWLSNTLQKNKNLENEDRSKQNQSDDIVAVFVLLLLVFIIIRAQS